MNNTKTAQRKALLVAITVFVMGGVTAQAEELPVYSFDDAYGKRCKESPSLDAGHHTGGYQTGRSNERTECSLYVCKYFPEIQSPWRRA